MIETGKLRASFKNTTTLKYPFKPFKEEGNIGKFPPIPTKKTVRLRKKLNKILSKMLSKAFNV